MSDGDFVSTATAARMLGIPGENGKRQVRRLIASGVLRSERIGKRGVHYVLREDVERARSSCSTGNDGQVGQVGHDPLSV